MARKKTEGRKKIEMKMIADENARRVTFSKRRNGLFKKASELSTLCGVEIAIIVFSIGGRAFTFGHPNVDSIIDRFLNEDKQVEEGHSISHAMKYKEAKCHELKQRFNEIHQEVEDKRKQRKSLINILAKSPYKSYEEYAGLDDLCELQQLKEKMKNLKEKVALQQDKLLQKSIYLKHVEERNMKNIEKYTLDGSPIPNDWLRL